MRATETEISAAEWATYLEKNFTMMMMMMLQMLISVTSCNVNAADSDQTTPLVMAALQGNAVICETLVCVYSIWLHVLLTSFT